MGGGGMLEAKSAGQSKKFVDKFGHLLVIGRISRRNAMPSAKSGHECGGVVIGCRMKPNVRSDGERLVWTSPNRSSEEIPRTYASEKAFGLGRDGLDIFGND